MPNSQRQTRTQRGQGMGARGGNPLASIPKTSRLNPVWRQTSVNHNPLAQAKRLQCPVERGDRGNGAGGGGIDRVGTGGNDRCARRTRLPAGACLAQARSGGGDHSSPMRRAAINASCGICTEPYSRIRFLPSFCLSSSFFLREMSPP